MGDDEGWGRVPAHLQRALDRKGVTLRQLEAEAKVAMTTVRKLLDGEPVRRRDRLVALAKYLGWPDDAFDRIRRGLDPVPEGWEPPSVVAAIDADPDLSAEAKRLLRGLYETARGTREG